MKNKVYEYTWNGVPFRLEYQHVTHVCVIRLHAFVGGFGLDSGEWVTVNNDRFENLIDNIVNEILENEAA